ncbi:MAG: sortase, partial [Candidatus Saccharibacteria bacterium]|nr:sortase [Candidatus Saccharibacteria bacterium]
MTKSTKSAKKSKELANSRVRMSFTKHLLPPLAGLLVALAVFGFFNSSLISGKIAYRVYSRRAHVSSLDNQTASSNIDKNAPPKITINKINVTAPINFDQSVVNQGAFQKALQHAVVHYPNTAVPGQPGNIVI